MLIYAIVTTRNKRKEFHVWLELVKMGINLIK